MHGSAHGCRTNTFAAICQYSTCTCSQQCKQTINPVLDIPSTRLCIVLCLCVLQASRQQPAAGPASGDGHQQRGHPGRPEGEHSQQPQNVEHFTQCSMYSSAAVAASSCCGCSSSGTAPLLGLPRPAHMQQAVLQGWHVTPAPSRCLQEPVLLQTCILQPADIMRTSTTLWLVAYRVARRCWR
jgi:hypothetical protein